MDEFQESKRAFLKTLTLATASYGLMPLTSASKTRKPAGDDFWQDVRSQFSLRTDHVYFNNGTVGPSPDPVLNAVIAAMKQVELTGEHRESDGDLLRAKLAAFIGADKDEISLTHNTTEGINIVAQGVSLKAGDEVIITTHEHVGNALPWLNRARVDGAVLKSFAPPATTAEVLQTIEALITTKTKLIAVPHISCTTGQVFPIAEIATLAHSKKIHCFVDGAHSAGMLPLDLRASGVDFYSSCGHKWLCGPKGTGFLYVKKELLDFVDAKFVGANSDIGWILTPDSQKITGFKPNGHRYDYGSQNTALQAGLSASLDFFSAIGIQKISDYGCGLAAHLHEELSKRNAIEVLTPAETKSRAMMTSFRFRDSAKTYTQFAAYAGKNLFRVRQVPEASLNAIRVSTHLYNSKTEVDRFIALIDSFLET